jgi:hypothetical protein
MSTTIQPLKKVRLTVLAGSKVGEYRLTPSPVVFEFLYGIGADGLTPFEMTLGEKKPGDNLTVTVAAGEASMFFGRLLGSIRNLLGLQLFPTTLSLQMTVTAVNDAENREVVQALARSTGHGCDGSCDCGCGSA